MKPTRSHLRAEVTVAIVVGLALVTAAAYLFRPKALDGDTQRAEAGIEATAALTAAHAAELAARDAQAATAAASVAQIGTAAHDLPPSPATTYVAREVPLALANLPKPDPAALLAAEQRRLAVMEGRLSEADRLYRTAHAEARQLAERAAAAERERDAALADRQQADREIAEAAAARLALTRQRNLSLATAALLLVGFLVVRFYLVGPGTLGRIAADVRAGANPITALDTHLPPWMHRRVRHAAADAKDSP